MNSTTQLVTEAQGVIMQTAAIVARRVNDALAVWEPALDQNIPEAFGTALAMRGLPRADADSSAYILRDQMRGLIEALKEISDRADEAGRIAREMQAHVIDAAKRARAASNAPDFEV